MRLNGKRLLSLAGFLLAAMVCHLPAFSVEELPTEQSMRAAMVFNFLKFTEFMPEVIGKAPFLRMCVDVRDLRQAKALATLAGRKVSSREMVILNFNAHSTDCHVYYVDSRQRWYAALGHPALRNALTISAYPGFAREDGMIEIAMQDDRVRFDINLAEGRRAGFRFSPQMLRLARQIYE
jgi:hypothetical protein